MKGDRGPGAKPPQRSRGGEQFADPLAYNPDGNRGGAPAAPRIPAGMDPSDAREREIARRILQEYGHGPLDAVKPIMAAVLVGLIVFSQVDKTNMLNAVIYVGMAMCSAGAIYVMILRDSLPPLLSMLFRGCFILGVLAVIGWFIVNHSDTFQRPPEARENRTYRSVQDPTVQ